MNIQRENILISHDSQRFRAALFHSVNHVYCYGHSPGMCVQMEEFI